MDRIIKIFIPTAFQVIVVSMLSILTLLTIYGPSLFARLLTGEVSTYVGQSYTDQLVRLNSVGFVRTGVIALFWALVGLMAYGVYLAVTNAIVEARNEIVIDTEYTNRGAGSNAYNGVFKQLGSGVFLIIIIIISALWLLPVWSHLFETAIFFDLTVMNVFVSIVGVVGLTINQYLIWALFQVTWEADRL